MKIDISVNDNVIVFGSGTIAANCIKYLREKIKGDIFVFEQKQNAVSVLQRQLSGLSKVHYQVVDENIVDAVNKIKSKIIFSINNIYIFSKELIDNHLIINYHNSLLPKHPGRFAEAWAIFEEEKKTGITWHLVVPEVDKGEMILQKDIEIPPHGLSALNLLSLQTKLAYESFKEIINSIYNEKYLNVYEQEQILEKPKFHFSWEKPNNGYLDLSWNINKISAFLRSMDYGILNMLGNIKIVFNNQEYVCKKYSIEEIKSKTAYSINLVNNSLEIKDENTLIKLINLKEI